MMRFGMLAALTLMLAAASGSRPGQLLSGPDRIANQPLPPFRIIDNLYYVGTRDIGVYLIVDRQGLILLDGGYEASAPIILRNIRALGFEPKKVRYLLNSQAHFDHAGGLAALKRATGARMLASPGDAPVLERGGTDDFGFGNRLTFAPVRVDATVADGQTIAVGLVRLTAHLTPGHTKGCTTWTLPVHEGQRELTAMFVCGAGVPGYKLVGNGAYPAIVQDYEHSFAVWRSLSCDIFLGAHGSYFDLLEKTARSGSRRNPLLDPQGCRSYLAHAEAAFRAQLATERSAARH